MTDYIAQVKRIEKVKTDILDMDVTTEELLTAIKGAEYVLLLRLASEKRELSDVRK